MCNPTISRLPSVFTATEAMGQAVGALLRYFHDLDTAEEAYQ